MDYILNSSHIQEVKKYMAFFELKRKESIEEVQTAFSQSLKKNFKDEIFSWNEVEAIITELRDEIKATVDNELQNIVFMSGVYIKILMSQAESHNFDLRGDVSFVENEKAIEEMRSIGEADKILASKKTIGGRLPTLQAGAVNEINALAKAKEAAEERDTLKRRNLDQQLQISELIDEVNRLNEVIDNLSVKREKNNEVEVKEVNQALEETKLELRTKEELIQNLKQEQEKRLADSKQFQSLKKLIQSKNEQIKELRDQ